MSVHYTQIIVTTAATTSWDHSDVHVNQAMSLVMMDLAVIVSANTSLDLFTI